jgi:hypothetical protein
LQKNDVEVKTKKIPKKKRKPKPKNQEELKIEE